MKLKITTKSGSIYDIWNKDGKIFFRQGIFLSGEIVKLHKEIQVGGSLTIDYRKNGLYGNPDDNLSFLDSTPITNIKVSF